jgi:hypothetical protein
MVLADGRRSYEWDAADTACHDDRMDLDQRQLALIIARARAVNGLVLLLVPGIASRLLFGHAGRNPVVRATLRITGVRDLVLGVGAITTLKEHTMDAEWVGMGAVADMVDGAVLTFTPGIGPRARLASVAGWTFGTVGYVLSRGLADARDNAELSEVEG